MWTYESPYPAVASIKDYLAFYPDRVDAIEDKRQLAKARAQVLVHYGRGAKEADTVVAERLQAHINALARLVRASPHLSRPIPPMRAAIFCFVGRALRTSTSNPHFREQKHPKQWRSRVRSPLFWPGFFIFLRSAFGCLALASPQNFLHCYQ